MIKNILLSFLFLWSVGALSEETSQDIGKAKAESLRDYFGDFTSSSGVKNKLQTPLTSSNKLTTFDGSSSFDAQLGCQASSEYLRTTIAPLSSGDVRFLAIEQDTSMDGKIDTVATPDWIISGVCANGFITCAAGTWNACKNMIWTANKETNQIGAYQGALTDLGGCYCINNSCGKGLAFSNLETILGTLGGGMSAALTANNPFYSMSGSKITDTTMKFYGSDPTACSNASLDKMVGSGSASNLTSYASGNVNQLKNAGSSELSSNALAFMVQNSQLNNDGGSEYKSCLIKRVIPIDEVVLEDIIGLNSGSGSVTACGSDCLLLTLGRVGDNYWGGNCSIYDQSVSFYVKKPERILSAKLNHAAFDDWIQVRANDNVFWSGPYNNWNSKTNRPPGKCELSTNWRMNPNVDFTQYLRQEGVVDFFVRTEVTGGGEGYARAQIKVDTECKLQEDFVSDSCKPYKENSDCVLINETVDGVEVYKNYSGTGLVPLPTTQTVSGQNCSFNVTRNWFEKKRNYICKNKNKFDVNSIINRKSVVSKSAKNGDEDVSDIRYDIDKGIVNASVNIQPYTAYSDGQCTQVCKTRSLVNQSAVGTGGVTGSKAKNPTVYEFSYKQCDYNNVCPSRDGEEIVQACSCSSDFANATAIMMTLRLAGQGMMCTSGELKPME